MDERVLAGVLMILALSTSACGGEPLEREMRCTTACDHALTCKEEGYEDDDWDDPVFQSRASCVDACVDSEDPKTDAMIKCGSATSDCDTLDHECDLI